MTKLNLAAVVTGSLVMGLVVAAALVVGPFGGAPEHVITGTALLGFAAGWALLAGLSIKWTDQPQRWATVPAAYMAFVGTGLLVFKPTGEMLNALGWVWPPVVLALSVWMTVQARQHLRSRTRIWVLYPLFFLYAASALGGGYQTIRESIEQRIWAQSGSLIEVNGHELYLSCIGAGAPTVVLESGLGETSAYWDGIATAVSMDAKVCVYDRAGRGGSEPSPLLLDGKGVAAELHALLARANISAPFVLVGHSSGAQYVRIFAGLFPAEIAGVVLLDGQPAEAFAGLPMFPSFYRNFRRVSALLPSIARIGVGRFVYQSDFGNLPAHVREMQRASRSSARWFRSLRDEFAELPIALDQAHFAGNFGNKPLIVVSAGRDAQPGWLPLQDELVRLSKNSLHRVLPNATHMSIIEGADSVSSIEAIRDVIQVVRDNGAFPSFPHQSEARGLRP